MNRTFQQHSLRPTRSLDGLWDFVTDPEDKGIQKQWNKHFPTDHRQMPVPACWNNELGLFDYRGAAWYRTSITVNEAQHLRLIFHAVLGFADVFWDGEPVVSHYGGYTPFEFIVKHATAGVHELIIRTDNRLDEQTLPYHVVDWFHYGGIIRPVELQVLPDVYIEAVRADYEQTSEDSIRLSCRVELCSLGDAAEVPLTLRLDGQTAGSQQVQVPTAGKTVFTFEQMVEKPRLWNVGEPELYKIDVFTDEDDLTDRIGFRFISTANGRILVNGKEVYLQGVNRHEEHPEWGFAFPPKLMHKELDILKDLGCNSVRGSHYPQSPYWLDLLDENGLLYWSEIPIWGAHTPIPVLADPLVKERAESMIREMIQRDFNHPSIMFWSVHNEIDTGSQEAYELSVALSGLVRSLDQTRLVTCAINMPLTDIVMPLFDVIGINAYHGWYSGKVEGFKDMLEEFHARAAAMGCSETPLLMTEFGGAGIQGDSGWEPRLFSEDYQAHILAEALRIFREDSRISGTYVWQYADIRGDLRSDRTHFRDRARSFNNKGLLNEYRKPKLSYRVVRDIYKADRYPLPD